jgi:hypothetical protein
VVRQPEAWAGGRIQLGDRLPGPAVEAELERSGERPPERAGRSASGWAVKYFKPS